MVRVALLVVVAALAGCGAKYNEARKVDGQTYYVQQEMPNLGERAVYGATHDCSGGVRDDAAALKLMPAIEGCKRSSYQVEYVVDGVHRVEACNERWRIKCIKSPSSRSRPENPPPMTTEPLHCNVECLVEDHYTATQ